MAYCHLKNGICLHKKLNLGKECITAMLIQVLQVLCNTLVLGGKVLRGNTCYHHAHILSEQVNFRI